jgi:hypothetical protein
VERNSKYEKDKTVNNDNGISGDGCHNCCHNPKFVSMRKKIGKPKIDTEVFEEAMEELSHAYGVELEKETYDVYWNHLAYVIFTGDELKDAIYSCIDTYPEYPAISEIIEMGMQLKVLKR